MYDSMNSRCSLKLPKVGLLVIPSPDWLAFGHDKIQQAAYDLVPDADKPLAHLLVGRSLLQGLEPEELDANLFLVVNQLIVGKSLLSNEDDKRGLAEMCIQAAKKASRACDFETATSYLHISKDLLPARHWRDEYATSLELFCSWAEVLCCAANFDAMDEVVDEIFANCRCLDDRLRAYQTKIYSLGVRSRFEEATKFQ